MTMLTAHFWIIISSFIQLQFNSIQFFQFKFNGQIIDDDDCE